ncbi:MAG: DUF547 domain-containing protein [Verrucomicrobiota bacterium]
MKTLSLITAFLLFLITAILFCTQILSAKRSDADEVALYSGYAELLQKYATDTGVRYAEWAENKEDLFEINRTLGKWAQVDLETFSTSQQKAFYINLYNLAMLAAVFDAYPINSVTEILPDFGIFTRKFIKQGNRTLSLDDVEKAILLKKYPDPRIHWSVNCASRSCPPLRAEPFISSRLDQQMDEMAQKFLNSPSGVQLDRDFVRISALFDWYRSDFPDGNLLEYINRYRKESAIPTDLEIQFLYYDWDLNTPMIE